WSPAWRAPTGSWSPAWRAPTGSWSPAWRAPTGVLVARMAGSYGGPGRPHGGLLRGSWSPAWRAPTGSWCRRGAGPVGARHAGDSSTALEFGLALLEEGAYALGAVLALAQLPLQRRLEV